MRGPLRLGVSAATEDLILDCHRVRSPHHGGQLKGVFTRSLTSSSPLGITTTQTGGGA